MANACFLASTSSGVMMSVGLAVALGVPVTVGVPPALGVAVMVGVPLAFGVAVATAALLLPALLEAFCSWPSLHPARPEQASRVKANAA